MHLALVTAPAANNSSPQPVLRHLRLCESDAAGRTTPARIDLMVIDARGMTTACTHEALQIALDFSTRGIFRRAILLCSEPSRAIVVAAMRAGIGDIYFGALTAKAFLKNLRVAWPRRGRLLRGQIAPLVAAWSLLEKPRAARTRQPVSLTEREIALRLREDAVQAEALRIADDRLLLEKRTEDLLARERLCAATGRRLQEESERIAQARDQLEEAAVVTATLQRTASRPPMPPPVPATAATAALREKEAALQARLRELDEREKAIASRENLLREYETMLTGRPVVPAGASANPWS